MDAHVSQGNAQPDSEDLKFSARNPLSVERWERLKEERDPHEQGQLLAYMYWLAEGAIPILPEALDSLPDQVLTVVHGEMVGMPETRSEWDPAPSNDAFLTPDGTVATFPAFYSRGDRSYSIIAASVDEHLTWRVVVMIQDKEGNMIAPSLNTSSGLLSAPILAQDKREFSGIHLTIRPSRSIHPGGRIDQCARLRLSLLLSPPLERQSLLRNLKSGDGRLADIAGKIVDRYHPDLAEANYRARVFPEFRAAFIVVEPRDPAAGLVAVDYTQEHGILGEFTTHGPFRPFTTSLSELLTADSLSYTLAERCRNLREHQTQYTDKLVPRATLPHAPVSYALVRAGYCDLDASARAEIRDWGNSRFEPSESRVYIEAIVALKRGEQCLLPSSDREGIASEDEEGVVLSFPVDHLQGSSEAQVTFNAARHIVRAASFENGSSLIPDYVGALFSPRGFASALEALASETPERSPFFALMSTSIAKQFASMVEGVTHPQWRQVTFEFSPNPESDEQTVSVLIRHTLGFSRFSITRCKDTGFIGLDAEGNGISHETSFDMAL
jgi:hypothetical protein